MINRTLLKDIVHYCPETGLFYARIGRGKTRAGSVLGYKEKNGYLKAVIYGKKYWLHRLAWFYMHGEFPEEVDHKNRIRNDNRIDNLRAANKLINMKNCSLFNTNTSSVTGVSFNKRKQRWRAFIGYNGLRIELGTFKTFEEACDVRTTAEKVYGYTRETFPEELQ